MNIGVVIKNNRQKSNMTQTELAACLNITPQAVSRWEMGISYPDIAMLPRISEVLRVSADELLGIRLPDLSGKEGSGGKDGSQDAWLMLDDDHETTIRNAWTVDGATRRGARKGTASCKAMHNEGGRPFFFPGKVEGYEQVVPDYDRINPEYFKVLDKKIDWLNRQGITVFMEVLRRDCSRTWKYYYDWPIVYTRYVQ